MPQNSENLMQFTKKTPSYSFVTSSVTEAQVSSLFSSLDAQKASLDIPNKLIKIAAELLSKRIAYNQSIATSIVPDDFKISKLRQYMMGDTGNRKLRTYCYLVSIS